MSESQSERVIIKTQRDLWAALKRALEHKGRVQPFEVDFSQSEWAKIHITYDGERFHSSLTPSAMTGLIQLQAGLYRSAAVILKGSSDARLLTHLERSSLELSFKISEGSAETEGEGKGFLSTLVEGLETMDSRHKLIAVLVLGLTFFGEKGFEAYLAESGKSGAVLSVMKHDEEHEKLLTQALKSKPAAEVHQEASNAFDSVVRHSGDVESLTVQGTTLEREDLDKLKSTARRVSRNVTYDELFNIVNVDPSAEEGFEIEVQSVETGESFKAVLYDSMASDAMKTAIRKAEWSKKPVRLIIAARLLGDKVVEARITKATNPRSKPLLIKENVIRSEII